MTKPELIKGMAGVGGTTQAAAERMLAFLLDTLANEVATVGRSEIFGFGVFKRSPRKEAVRYNPKDRNDRFTVPAHNTVTFKPSPPLKTMVNP